MSIRNILRVTSLVCMMPLAACEEESEDPSPDELEDASFPVSQSDAGWPWGSSNPIPVPAIADAGTPAVRDAAAAPIADASAPVVSSDAAAPSTPVAADRAHFFLPTGDPANTAEAVVEIDRQDNVHTVYPGYVGGGAYYAFCAKDACDQQSDAKVVKLETDGTVDNAMLALTSDGKPRVVLSTYLRVYYAQCDQGCSARNNWTLVELLNHGSDLTASGEALALDGQGRPRFLLHGRRNPYDFFAPKRPETQLVECDAACESASNWRFNVIASKEIWEGSHLRYDASGRAHVATTLFNYGETVQPPLSAYLTCQGTCNAQQTWKGTGFGAPVEALTDAVSVYPAVSLALTKAGKPRVAMLVKDDQGKRSIGYAECDAVDCSGNDVWRGINLWAVDTRIGAGIDLALDSKDRPVFAHTMNYDILLTYCQAEPCTANGAKWDSTYVERSSEIPADSIFLEWNCTVGGWFLHTPSLAFSSNDKPRVGYQSRDISGGVSRPDPLKPRCQAGTDMTWSRLALLPSYIQQ